MLGQSLLNARHIRNMSIDNKLVVTEYVENEKFAIESKQNKLILNYFYSFTQGEEGTKVSFIGKVRTKGIKNFMYKPLIEKIIKREDGDHLEKMKQYIEENVVKG